MSKILSLSKVLFIEQFKAVFSKVSAGKKLRDIVLIVFLGILILFSIGSSYFAQYMMLDGLNMGQFMLFYGIINVVLVLLMLFTLQIQTSFFEAKDYELLASLPLKNHEIVLSKLLAQLANAYLLSFFIFAPSLPFLFLSQTFGVVSVLFLVIGFVFLPFFNLFVATIFSYAINLVSQLFKNPKKAANALAFVFMLMMVIAIMILNFGVLNKIMEIGGIPKTLNYVFPTATQYFYSVINADLKAFLFFVVLNIMLALIIVYLLSKTYFKINKVKKSVKKRKKGEISFQPKSVFLSLLKFEFKQFLSIPIYVFNVSIGAIILSLATVALPFVYFLFVKGSQFEVLLYQKEFMLNAAFMIALGAGIANCTTFASVSIDGQMHYYKKSLPISFKKNMLAKLGVNMILVIPTLAFLTAALPFLIMAKFYVYEILFLFVFAILAQLFSALVGLISNLLFIKLNWSNPTILVKQSIPSFIYALNLILVFTAVFSLMPFVLEHISIQLYALIIFFALTLLSGLMWLLISTVGKKKYFKIN